MKHTTMRFPLRWLIVMVAVSALSACQRESSPVAPQEDEQQIPRLAAAGVQVDAALADALPERGPTIDWRSSSPSSPARYPRPSSPPPCRDSARGS